MPPPPPDRVIAVEVSLEPAELIAAWRPEARRLVIALREPSQARQRVAARISAVGLGVAATITGRVVSARRQQDLFRTEVEPDEIRVRALERLVAVAGGERIAYQPRAPRLLAALPAIVHGLGGPIYMTTFSVSEGGCGLVWSGPIPAVGVPMELRLGAGNRVASFCVEVCWTTPAGRPPTVGVRFAAGERSVWRRILAELKCSGAPPA